MRDEPASAANHSASGWGLDALLDLPFDQATSSAVNWLEVPPGAAEELRSHEEAEQVYIVVSGSCAMSATGDTQRLEEGDLVLIPPATDHAIANDGEGTLALVSVQSPAVSADELYSRRLATQAAGYDDFDEE